MTSFRSSSFISIRGSRLTAIAGIAVSVSLISTMLSAPEGSQAATEPLSFSEGIDVAGTPAAPVADIPAPASSISETPPPPAVAEGAINTVSTGDSFAPEASVQVLNRKEAEPFGTNGMVVKVTSSGDGIDDSAVDVRIPDSVVDAAFGGDFSSRVQWIQVAGPGDKSTAKVLEPEGNSAGATVLETSVSTSPTYLVAAGAPTSTAGTGSYAATPFNTATAWDVSAQTGDFSWSYPLTTPPAPAGPTPDIQLSYDSQVVDGATGSSNNQPSAVGEGWSLGGSGFIERQYVSCSKDDGPSGAIASSGDLCWKTDNASISFAGHSGALIRDAASGVWRLQGDDGSRIEHLVGTAQGCAPNGTRDNDCWRLTTTDGTQYWFGLNQLPGWTTGAATTNSAWTVPVFGNDTGEPCHASTFATSSCSQAWRWNLDYIVDTHSNAQSLYYHAESNRYARNRNTPTAYIRGGQLARIDYGFVSGNAYASNAASSRVLFDYDTSGRCSDSSRSSCSTLALQSPVVAPANATSYPDVPFDQLCSTGTCAGLLSPSFWTTGMLDAVRTQVLIAGSYTDVDKWKLGHSFPSPGDGTDPALWLTDIVHTGYLAGSSISEPATVFYGQAMQNRVWPVDGLVPLDKYRITSIRSSLGAVTSVTYSAQECTPANAASIKANVHNNKMRCYPQWWTPDVTYPSSPQLDLFHKYVVTSVVSNPVTGGANDQSTITSYLYTGTPAWRYNDSPFTPATYRTWSDYAGYDRVEVRLGDPRYPAKQQTTQYSFYQGMDGDRASTTGGAKTVFVAGSTTERDSKWFAGLTRETKTLNGASGSVISTELATPWASAVTGTDGTRSARYVADGVVRTTEPLSTGGTRTVTDTTTYDSSGLPVLQESTASDVGTTCTKTTYAPSNTAVWLVGLAKEIKTFAVGCSTVSTSTAAADAISAERIAYDGGAVGSTPTKGDGTQNYTVDAYTGSTIASARWVTTSKTKFDARGRAIEATDALNRTTTTSYSPSSGPITTTKTTGPAPTSWTVTNTLEPTRGLVTKSVDQNIRGTSVTYDALGRLTAVWFTDRPQVSYPDSPSRSYEYSLSTTAPNAIVTSTIAPSSVVRSFDLFDGLGRSVQTQSSSLASGGAVISDTAYDSTGAVSFTNAPYWTTSVDPSTTPFVPESPSQIPSTSVSEYDGAGRVTAAILMSTGTERYRTTTSYLGADRVDITPPTGGTPTSTISDSRGLSTSLVQYRAPAPSSTAPKVTTSYTYNRSGEMTGMTSPDGTTWSWEYDALGRDIKSTDPDSGTTTRTYNLVGDLLTSTDARGVTLAYAYDGLGRKIGLYKGSTGSTGLILASWTWDTLAKGQLTSSTAYVGSTPGVPGAAYTSSITSYDSGYRAKGTTLSIPAGAPAFAGKSFTRSMTYAAGGALSTVAYPAEGGLAAETVRYSYNSFGVLDGVNGTDPYTGVDYTALGQVGQLTRNDVSSLFTGFGYDAATGAVKNINQMLQANGEFTDLAKSAYSYNDAGNVTAVDTTSDVAARDAQCFSYDELQNLKRAWTPASGNCAAPPSTALLGGPAPYWTDYSVSAETGNRLSVRQNPARAGQPTVTETYNYPAVGSPRRHAVTTVSKVSGSTTTTATYGYDAAGNTTSRPGQTLTYNSQGKLSAVTAGSATQSNIYDADGTLLLRVDSAAGATLYLGDTQLSTASGSTTVSAVRTYSAGGVPVAQRVTKAGVTGSTLNFLGVDAQGTGQLAVNATTGAVTTRRMDPFGNVRGTGTTWPSRQGFLNQPVSATTGLTQLGARAYDPGLGRFTSVDAVLSPFNPQQNNGYSYSENNPVTRSDASGNCSTSGDNWGSCVRDKHGGIVQTAAAKPAGNVLGTVKSKGVTCEGSLSFNKGSCGKPTLRVDRRSCSQYSGAPGCTPRMMVSTDPDQLAINQAIGDQMAIASVRKNHPTWVFDLYMANRGFAQAGRPLVLLILAGAAGSGGVSTIPTVKASTAAPQQAVSTVKVSMPEIRAMGLEGERLSGIIKNQVRIPSATGTAKYRTPDELNDKKIGEVKYRKNQALTYQLRDNLAFAAERGLQFNLYVRESTRFSGPLQEQVDLGTITRVPNLGP